MAKTRFCGRCGEALKKKANFCPECGASTHASSARRPRDAQGTAIGKSEGGPRVGVGAILVLVLIALVLFVMWWKGFFTVPESSPEDRTESAFWQTTLDEAPLVEADALLRAYEEDLARANGRFDRKVIAVRGGISEVSTSGIYVEFEAAGARRLRCSLRGREADKLAGLSPGDTVTIAGLCVGTGKYDDRVHLRMCRLRE